MGMQEKMLPAAIFGTGVGALGYVVGGVAAPFVPGVTSVAYAALGFLLAVAYTLNASEAK